MPLVPYDITKKFLEPGEYLLYIKAVKHQSKSGEEGSQWEDTSFDVWLQKPRNMNKSILVVFKSPQDGVDDLIKRYWDCKSDKGYDMSGFLRQLFDAVEVSIGPEGYDTDELIGKSIMFPISFKSDDRGDRNELGKPSKG